MITTGNTKPSVQSLWLTLNESAAYYDGNASLRDDVRRQAIKMSTEEGGRVVLIRAHDGWVLEKVQAEVAS